MKPQNFVPAKSEAYLAAEPFFFATYNDVHFFVEDENCENLYHAILRRFFPALSIEKIFPLNGKDAVIAHARSREKRSKLHVYLVDLDFDGLLSRVQKIQGLFYLSEFCIENYLLEEKAFIEAMAVVRPKKRKDSIAEALDFEQRLAEYLLAFRELYALFLVVTKHRLKLPTTGDHYRRYVDTRSAMLPNRARVDALRKELALALKARIDNFSDYLDMHEKTIGTHRSHFCGKHILDALMEECHKIFPCHERMLSRDSFSVLLAHHCKFEPMKPITAAMEQYISKHQGVAVV